MAQQGTLGVTRYVYGLQDYPVDSGWLVLALRVACPPWDCLGLPIDALLAVPLRSTPIYGCSMGQGCGA